MWSVAGLGGVPGEERGWACAAYLLGSSYLKSKRPYMNHDGPLCSALSSEGLLFPRPTSGELMQEVDMGLVLRTTGMMSRTGRHLDLHQRNLNWFSPSPGSLL